MENNVEVTSMTQCASRPRKLPHLNRRTAAMSTSAQVDVQIKAIYSQIECVPYRNPRAILAFASPCPAERFFQIETPTRAPSRTPIAVP